MNRIFIKTFVTLALLLSISEVALGGTVRIASLLDGAVTDEMLGEVSHSIDQSSGLCTITVAPAYPYRVMSITANKVIDAGNAQSRRNAPGVNVPIGLSAGTVENTWLFTMPSEEYDVEVNVNFTSRITEYYPLWVMGIQIHNLNKDNVLGGGTVRFNPATNTLSLYDATIVAEDEVPVFRSELDSLAVELHGNNIMKFENGFVSQIAGKTVPLVFSTNEDVPGQLTWETTGELSSGFAVSCLPPLRSFDVCNAENLISVKFETIYDLKIGDIDVTSVNYSDVLGNNRSEVRYLADSQTLVFENATLDVPVTSGLEGVLTIHLIGDNTISGTDNLIVASGTGADLSFTTSDTKPGSLTLTKTNGDGTWISGFVAASVPNDYATTTDGNTMTIARVVPITPIVSETDNGEQPKTEEPTDGFGQEASGKEEDDYLNVVVNNVLYTLKAGDYEAKDDDSDPDDVAGVNLSETPADMDDVLTKKPGSDDYADAFKGLTIEVPEGNGQVMVTGEIGRGAKLAVKIGDSEPMIFPNEQGFPDFEQLETLYIPYSCTQPTYVYIYMLPGVSNDARFAGSLRGRVLTGHVKITSVGASSSLVVSNNSYSTQDNAVSNRVIAYSLPSSATTPDNTGVVMSTVGVETSASASTSRGQRRAIEQRKITELGASVFDELDKKQILYIDLSGTDVKDMTVNRSSGLFDGFGHNTLVYLPVANDDGGEDNVVLGDKCARLNLVDEADFRAHKDFAVESAQLERTITAGRTSTVFLPFALNKTQADALGNFHKFKEIVGANAVFQEAETNGTKANTPYIFVPSASKIEAQNVTVEGLEDFQAVDGNMIGTYETLLWADEQTDIYGFAAADLDDVSAGQFVRVGAGAWLPPFRAFIQFDGSSPSRLNVVIDGQATGIMQHSSSDSNAQSEIWYTISGQRFSGVPSVKGLYITNGKKVTVK